MSKAFHVEHHFPMQKRLNKASSIASVSLAPVTRSSAARAARRFSATSSKSLSHAQAAIAPIYTAEDIVAEEQFAAIGAIRRVEDSDLGPLLMNGGLFRSTEGGAEIGFTGRDPGADTDAVLAELGHSPERIATLRATGAVA